MAAPNPVPDSHPSDAPILVDPDDPSVMFEFQRLLHRLGAKSTITDDFTPTANAEQLAALLVDSSVSAKVWPAFKASMPALIVKAYVSVLYLICPGWTNVVLGARSHRSAVVPVGSYNGRCWKQDCW